MTDHRTEREAALVGQLEAAEQHVKILREENVRLLAQLAALREALMEERWNGGLYQAPTSALNQVPVKGPLGGVSGNDIRRLAELRGWCKWEGENDNYN